MERKNNELLVPIARNHRNNPTAEEKKLWYDFLKPHPVRFNRQKVLGQYIADFYSAQAKMVIEVDGGYHYSNDKLKTDQSRTEYLKQFELIVIRIDNDDIRGNFNNVCHELDHAIKQRLSELSKK